MLAGAAVALIGVLISSFDLRAFGAFTGFMGCLLGGVGLWIHLCQFYRETTADPKDLYAPGKQPWER